MTANVLTHHLTLAELIKNNLLTLNRAKLIANECKARVKKSWCVCTQLECSVLAGINSSYFSVFVCFVCLIVFVVVVTVCLF